MYQSTDNLILKEDTFNNFARSFYYSYIQLRYVMDMKYMNIMKDERPARGFQRYSQNPSGPVPDTGILGVKITWFIYYLFADAPNQSGNMRTAYVKI